MTFPITVTYRRGEAKIYGKTPGYDFYRAIWYAGGKRHVQSFATFAEAKKLAKSKARELGKGSQAPALTAREVTAALSIRDALEGFRKATGRDYSPLECVTGYLDTIKLLPASIGPTEAVREYVKTLATITAKPLGDAVEAFLTAREDKAKEKDGKRGAMSPVYAAHVESWLEDFALTFKGHQVGDLTREHLAEYMKGFKELSEKSRNDRRATVGMFLRWCIRQDWLPASTRLLDADAMQREDVDSGETDFYRPDELQALLEASEGEVRAIIALQGLAGVRLQEALRLTWESVFRVPGHVEITAQNAKTRARRLVEIVPALALWLESYRGRTGLVAPSLTLNGHVSAFNRLRANLAKKVKGRESINIPSRRNGLRHAFCSYHFALHANENLTASQAGNSPQMIHAHYKGLATKAEAEAWFAVKPAGAAENIIPMKAAKK